MWVERGRGARSLKVALVAQRKTTTISLRRLVMVDEEQHAMGHTHTPRGGAPACPNTCLTALQSRPVEVTVVGLLFLLLGYEVGTEDARLSALYSETLCFFTITIFQRL